MARHRESDRPIRLLATGGLLLGMSLAPPVSAKVWALSTQLAIEETILWAASASFCMISLALLALGRRAGRALPGIYIGLLFLMTLELGVRVLVNGLADDDTRNRLIELNERTYPELASIRGHPFLQYDWNPRDGGRAYQVERPPDTIRIATLGGSTTASGIWGERMRVWLEQQAGADDIRFEVLNFAVVGYTSVHLLVSFVLNVVDYQPDYVVLHTGWNDGALRGFGHELKTDFSDVFLTFDFPTVPDRWLIRSSVVYRVLHNKWNPNPSWLNLPTILYHRGTFGGGDFDNPDGLRPFRRNLEKIIRFSEVRNIRVVLATLPHSTVPPVPLSFEPEHIDQCNAVVRELHEAFPEQTVLADLDAEMTGVSNHLFTDIAHMHPEGHQRKGVSVGRAILQDLRRRSQPIRQR